jgi:hypothetical protein
MLSNMIVWFISIWNAIGAFIINNAEFVRWNVGIVAIVLLAFLARYAAKRRIER